MGAGCSLFPPLWRLLDGISVGLAMARMKEIRFLQTIIQLARMKRFMAKPTALEKRAVLTNTINKCLREVQLLCKRCSKKQATTVKVRKATLDAEYKQFRKKWDHEYRRRKKEALKRFRKKMNAGKRFAKGHRRSRRIKVSTSSSTSSETE